MCEIQSRVKVRENSIQQLSEPLSLSVFTHLTLKERCICAVGWRLARSLLLKYATLVLRLRSTPPDLASDVLEWASASISSLSALDLQGFRAHDNISTQLAKLQHLKVLSLSFCRPLPSTILRYLPASLRELSLWDADIVTDRQRLEEEEHQNIVRFPRAELELCFKQCRALEVLDLRGQGAVDDKLVVEVLGNLQNLRKVALHGTKVTIQGGAALLECRKTSLTRAGFGGLLPASSSFEVPVLCGDVLRELSIPFARTPVNIDLANMPHLEFLYVDGIGTGGRGRHRVLDWGHLMSTKITQLMLNYATLPPEIVSILLSVAPQLKYLSLIKSDIMGRPSQRATPSPQLLESSKKILQLGLSSPNIDAMIALAKLPSLRILMLDLFDSQALLDVAGKGGDIQLFKSLEELVLSDTPDAPQDGICALLRVIPKLSSFAWKTRHAVLPADIFVILAALSAPHALHRLNLEGISKLQEVEDARIFVAQLVVATPVLASLAVPAGLFRTPLFIESVMSCFPSLRVLGNLERCKIGGWVTSGDRRLRTYDVDGYVEAVGVKPTRSFVNLLSFDGIDPLFGMSEP